ncbi:MAG: hypothetical protein HY866_03740 [Chloroflexi bacterium]|nr:hypothetical protein [Chloroflexota bacterium]
MAELSTITVLTTANLKGDLSLLPRLFTLIQQERRASSGLVLLFDLGDTCALEAWICHATQGRAPFLVLDGMGYDAAVIGGPEQVPIPPSSLGRLAGQMVMPFAIWNRVLRLAKRGITFHLAPGNPPLPEISPVIRVDRSTAALPGVGESSLMLGDVSPEHLARVDLSWPEWTVQAAKLVPVQPNTPPDPTILTLVEFVENEARGYADL